jgi:hypothetical protein
VALKSFTCSNGHAWDALTGDIVADPDLLACPSCGGTPLPAPVAGLLRRERTEHDYHPLELEEHREAQAHYSSPEFGARVLSGEVTLRENGPAFLRPTCHESLQKRIY